MNNLKNFIIFLLSVIVLVQAIFLLRSLPQGRHRAESRPTQRSEDRTPKAQVALKSQAQPVARKEESRAAATKEELAPVALATGKIALILDDWGYSLKNKDFIASNEFHVTLAVLPFRAHSAEVSQLAHQHSKDVIIHMPMEPQHKENYGLEESTLLTTMDKATVLRLLDSAFNSVPFAIGLSNHMGSKATEDTRLMKIILEYLGKKNFIFVDSFVTNKSVCSALAKKLKITFMRRDVFIDNESDPAYIRAQVTKLAQKAKRSGIAVGIGHDRPATVAVLAEMIPKLERDGYKFVNLSEIVDNKS